MTGPTNYPVEAASRLDIDACEDNLDRYAQAGDARSCRDIGLALARELATVRERADVLTDLAERLVSLDGHPLMIDRPTPDDMRAIVRRAREALGKEG